MRNAEIGMRNNAQRQWWASSAPLCKGRSERLQSVLGSL